MRNSSLMKANLIKANAENQYSIRVAGTVVFLRRSEICCKRKNITGASLELVPVKGQLFGLERLPGISFF